MQVDNVTVLPTVMGALLVPNLRRGGGDGPKTELAKRNSNGNRDRPVRGKTKVTNCKQTLGTGDRDCDREGIWN